MEFSSIDVVRHPLVQRIIDAYDREEKRLIEQRQELKDKEDNKKEE